MSSSGTWLVVHSGNVNLKGSNVGHQEGQNPSVEHLKGGDITGVHTPTPTSLTMVTPVETKKKQ